MDWRSPLRPPSSPAAPTDRRVVAAARAVLVLALAVAGCGAARRPPTAAAEPAATPPERPAGSSGAAADRLGRHDALHVVFSIRGTPRCVALARAGDRLRLAGAHGRTGSLRHRLEPGRLVLEHAAGSGHADRWAAAPGEPVVLALEAPGSADVVPTDRGPLFLSADACRPDAEPLDLGRFAGWVDWLFPARTDPARDPLAAAMRRGDTVWRAADAEPRCVAWRFLPSREDGLEGRFERRDRQGPVERIRSRRYRYDPTVRRLELAGTDEVRAVDGTPTSGTRRFDLDVARASEAGEDAVEVGGERWFFRRQACANVVEGGADR